ncbi:MAG: HAD hydrolase-like protein [Candidatus Binatia bacterium]
MKSAVNLFFDLDGTLTDPREGIVRCLQYALQKLGLPRPADAELERYIGPPLRQNFASLLQSDNPNSISHAVSLYRERFATIGLFENCVYPGIEDALTALQRENVHLYVVTGKPTVFATQILDHFGLSRFFRRTYGSELDGTHTNKGELIGHVLVRESIAPGDAIMIGDRDLDVRGALANEVTPLGVLWGYGSRQELVDAGASLLCERQELLVEMLTSRLFSA